MMKVELKEGYKIVKVSNTLMGKERTSAIYRQGEWARKFKVGQLTHKHPKHGAITVFEKLRDARAFLGARAFSAALSDRYNGWGYEVWECLYSPSIYGAFFVGDKKGEIFRLVNAPTGTDYAETVMITERACE